MRKKLSAALLLWLFGGGIGAQAQTPSLCSSNEAIYFSCKIAKSHKLVSLCGSGGDELTWLQYRFGSPSKLELVYPKNRSDSLRKFFGEHHRSYDAGDASVSFRNGNFLYSVVWSEGPGKSFFYGVRVASPNKETKEIPCEGMPESWRLSQLAVNLE